VQLASGAGQHGGHGVGAHVTGFSRRQAPRRALVDRIGLEATLQRGLRRPLLTITAGPGWGKTALLEHWARTHDMCWMPLCAQDRGPRHVAAGLLAARGAPDHPLPDTEDPERLAASLVEAIGPCPVALDDLHLLEGSPGLELVRQLASLRVPGLSLIVTSRRDIGLVGPRERGGGEVLELDARHLKLTGSEVAELLERELESDRVLAAHVWEVTGGWPAGVRLLVDALHDVPAPQRIRRLESLTAGTGPLAAYLRGVVLVEEDDHEQRLLTKLALVGQADPGRLASLTDTTPAEAAETGDELAARGLAQRDGSCERGRFTLIPAVRRAMLERVLPERGDRDEVVDEVVERLLEEGAIDSGLAVLTSAERPEAIARLLERHGERLLAGGRLAVLSAGAALLPSELRNQRIERIHGQALALLGDWAGALRCLDAAGAGGDGPLATELALSLGLVHHLRGDLDLAVGAYARDDGSGPPALRAELSAWAATAHWLRGETEQAGRAADGAMALATRARDDRALAIAHVALALVAASTGDRRANATHYRQALSAAERGGDALQQARALTNLGSLYLEHGDYDAARRETERAIDLADEQGYLMVLGIARCNRAEIALYTGALDEAVADAELARELFSRMGSRNEAYAHRLLGDIRRERGELALARQAYERSLRLAEPAGDRQGCVPANVGLARTLAHTDPEAAWDAARRAIELDDGMLGAETRLAAAWVACAQGRTESAIELTAEAADLAAARESKAAVAEVVTLRALLDDDPLPGLRQARQMWWEVGARISATRVELGIARRSPRSEERSRQQQLDERLRAWGCATETASFAAAEVMGATDHRPTAIRVLGAFAVERDGRPVPLSAWGSRKARELVKVLVARGRRGAAREELAHVLWPDEPYEVVANRLSVALSLLRGVLSDKDDAGPLVRSEGATLRLDLDRLDVDAERFRSLADAGLAAARVSEDADAIALLSGAVDVYGGDLLEEDRDALWVVGPREELRAQYLVVVRTLAALTAHDDPDGAMQLLLRILDRDPYDEPAHHDLCAALVRAGRHGEARRRHRVYEQRMRELGLPAVGFADLLGQDGGSSRGERAAVRVSA
jgi:ATP/maltotriose-dependent transcriptional regulator MalT/DNA-binding SARP family transcriptional activator